MEPIIEARHLMKSYKKRKSKEYIQAVNDISFTVNKGEIVGLLGPNGAGKTTTIKMICGLLIPDAGTITINGMDNREKRLGALRHISAVLEGNRNLYWRLTVRENLEYFAGNRGASRKDVAHQIEVLLTSFHLKEKEHELVNRLSRGIRENLRLPSPCLRIVMSSYWMNPLSDWTWKQGMKYANCYERLSMNTTEQSSLARTT